MSLDAELQFCLNALRQRSDAMAGDVEQLSRLEWESLSNCAPWRVKDLIVHVISSGAGFVVSIRHGLNGEVEAGPVNAERARRQAALEAADPTVAASALIETTSEFVGLYERLDDRQLAAMCFHRRGNRSVHWYALHRLAELAFHSWDLAVSLGRDAGLDDKVAAVLLPTLVESNAPRTYAAGLTSSRGRGERFALAVEGDTAARWTVTIDPERLLVSRSGDDADLSITAPAGALALLVYGRTELRTLIETHAGRVEGDLSLVDRFPLIFPRP